MTSDKVLMLKMLMTFEMAIAVTDSTRHTASFRHITTSCGLLIIWHRLSVDSLIISTKWSVIITWQLSDWWLVTTVHLSWAEMASAQWGQLIVVTNRSVSLLQLTNKSHGYWHGVAPLKGCGHCQPPRSSLIQSWNRD